MQDKTQLIFYKIGEYTLASPTTKVISIIPQIEIISSNETINNLLGIGIFRGIVISIINIHARLGIHSDKPVKSYIIYDTPKGAIAIPVNEILTVSIEQNISQNNHNFTGYKKLDKFTLSSQQVVPILELDKILNDEELDDLVEKAISPEQVFDLNIRKNLPYFIDLADLLNLKIEPYLFNSFTSEVKSADIFHTLMPAFNIAKKISRDRDRKVTPHEPVIPADVYEISFHIGDALKTVLNEKNLPTALEKQYQDWATNLKKENNTISLKEVIPLAQYISKIADQINPQDLLAKLEKI